MSLLFQDGVTTKSFLTSKSPKTFRFVAWSQTRITVVEGHWLWTSYVTTRPSHRPSLRRGKNLATRWEMSTDSNRPALRGHTAPWEMASNEYSRGGGPVTDTEFREGNLVLGMYWYSEMGGGGRLTQLSLSKHSRNYTHHQPLEIEKENLHACHWTRIP